MRIMRIFLDIVEIFAVPIKISSLGTENVKRCLICMPVVNSVQRCCRNVEKSMVRVCTNKCTKGLKI